MTLLGHLLELRSRLLWVVLTLIGTSAIGFQYKDVLLDIVMAPLNGEKLVYLTPGGGFSFIFTLCLYFGILLAIPVMIYQLYRFLQPMFSSLSRRFITVMLILSVILATTGALFGYFVAVPSALNFLTTFAGDAVAPNLTAESYLSFVTLYIVGLAAMFQIPLILYMVDRIKSIPPGGLSSSQRFVIIGATVAAAIITPTPDVINMAIVAVPIIVVYEIGVVAVFIRHRLQKKNAVVYVAASTEEELRLAERRTELLRARLRAMGSDIPERRPVAQREAPRQESPRAITVQAQEEEKPSCMISIMTDEPEPQASRKVITPSIASNKSSIPVMDGLATT